MLEDDFTHVIRKAFKGLSLSPSEAAVRAGLPENEVLAFSRGKFAAEIARGLAPVLGLDPEALATHPDYEPAPLDHPAITRLELPFGEDHVNAWLLADGGRTILFDTGDDKSSCFSKLRDLGITFVNATFITHGHADHIGGNDKLQRNSGVAYGPKKVRWVRSTKSGDIYQMDPFRVKVMDISGHAKPAFAYIVRGLSVPILIPGDAIFAGSIGGCPDPEAYRHALQRIRKVTSSLPDETIILPGHGPATTLGEERVRNPFLKALRSGDFTPPA